MQNLDPKFNIQNLVMTDQELMDADFPEIQWLVDKMIPNPGLIAISGRPGHFKSFFTMWLARCIVGRKPIFTEFKQPVPFEQKFEKGCPVDVKCLFVELEMSKQQTKSRSVALEVYDSNKLMWLIGSPVNIRDQNWINQLKDYIQVEDINLLIFDPFTSISQMADENSNSEASKVMDAIRRNFVDSELACSVIFLHHPAKSDDGGRNLRGAGDILGKCDMHLALEKTDKNGTVRVTYEKCRDVNESEVSNFLMQFRKNETTQKYEWIYLGEAKSGQAEKAQGLKDEILLIMIGEEWWARKDVAELVGINSNDQIFSETWSNLKKTGKIIKEGGKFRLKKE